METVIYARWIIPVNASDTESSPTLLENHALVIGKSGTIVDLLPASNAKQLYNDWHSQILDNHILIPGFINAHTHAGMSLFRGLADDLPLMEWLNHHIWPAEGKWVSSSFVESGTKLALAEMISSGTTCMGDMYFFPDIVAEVALATRTRAVLSCPLLDFPTNYANSASEYLQKAKATHAKFSGEPLIKVGIGPHAPYTVSDEPLKQCVQFAEQLDTHIQIHLHETEVEVNESLKKHQQRPTERLNNLGFFSNRVSAVHMTAIDEKDIEIIAQSSSSVVHCPESNLKLANGFCPTDAFFRAGINVALGTDGAASNNDHDMIGEMRTAAILGKAVAKNAAAIPAYQALRMATINGAKALGLESAIGSLEKGKQADIVAINIHSPHTTPLYNPISQLVYAAGREQVSDVWVAGKPLLKQSQLTTINLDQEIEKANAWSNKIIA